MGFAITLTTVAEASGEAIASELHPKSTDRSVEVPEADIKTGSSRWWQARARSYWSVRAVLPLLVLALPACSRDPASSREQLIANFVNPGESLTAAERTQAWAMLRDETEDRIIRELAAGALGRARDPEIVAFILERLPDSIAHAQQIDRSDRGLHPHMLAKALLEYAPKDPTVLGPLLSHSDEQVVAWTVTSYGFYRGNDKSLAVLTRSLADPRPLVRRRAADGFSQLFHPKAEPTILGYLNDPDAEVRHGLAWALLNYGTNRAVPSIDAALSKEQDAEVRSMLLRARGTAGSRLP